jgi:hypothetical protein
MTVPKVALTKPPANPFQGAICFLALPGAVMFLSAQRFLGRFGQVMQSIFAGILFSFSSYPIS